MTTHVQRPRIKGRSWQRPGIKRLHYRLCLCPGSHDRKKLDTSMWSPDIKGDHGHFMADLRMLYMKISSYFELH